MNENAAVRFMRFLWKHMKRIDIKLLLPTVAVASLSVLLLYSMYQNKASFFPMSAVRMQFFCLCIGVFLALVITFIDYHFIAKLWYIYLPVAVAMTCLTFTSLGFERQGSENIAWIDLGFITMQPSELLKIAFILSFAYHIYKLEDRINHPLNVLLLVIHGGIPLGLIIVQGDFGTALIFLAIFITMLFTAGISIWYILGAFVLAIPAGFLVWFKAFNSIHRSRIEILFNPGTDPLGLEYQQDLSLAAMGTGGLFGKGLFGDPEQYNYVPEVHNDFIFSYLGQALGFVGTISLIVVMSYICFKMLWSAGIAKDMLGKEICLGAFALLFSHCLLNIGMTLKVMPVIGVPLPFMSAGGSALVSMFLLIGIVMSTYAHREKKKHFFYEEE